MPIQLAQPADFADVLALQARYHVSGAAQETMAQGFVTTTLEIETLERMHAARALWIARDEDDGQLAAYACAVEWDFYAGSGFVERVFSHLPLPFGAGSERIVTADNSFLYGPTCIDSAFRGRGLLPSIVEAIGARYAATREFGVCFIDVRNERSLAAHERKLNFARLCRMPTSDPKVIYNMLGFSTR